jgi:hypothetical protein
MSWFRVVDTIEHHLPAWLHPSRAPPLQEEITPRTVHEGCDRLAARLQDMSLNRRELTSIATELQVLENQVEQLVAATVAGSGRTREARMAEDALQFVRGHLYWVQSSTSPWLACGVGEMRGELEQAVWSTRYAIIVLAWAGIPVQ